MRVRRPTWELRSVCPCCGQGGLTFRSCPQCDHVLVVCAELGSVFPDAHDLARMLEQDAEDVRCPSCGKVAVRDYRDATSEQIKALGFTPDQYQ